MFEAAWACLKPPRFKHDLMFDRWGGDLSNIPPETGFKHPQVSLRSSRKSEFPKNDKNVKNGAVSNYLARGAPPGPRHDHPPRGNCKEPPISRRNQIIIGNIEFLRKSMNLFETP